MASYTTFTSQRQTIADPAALLTATKTATGDTSAVLVRDVDGTYRGKKTTPWTAADLSATQAALDSAPALTPEVIGQRAVDTFAIEYKALVLALVDQINVIRAALPIPLVAITPAQAIAAIRNKAGTL